ncbi:MAG: hypothetical protein ACR2PI_24185, partial [Hyphomicrobiaceae bacterium]
LRLWSAVRAAKFVLILFILCPCSVHILGGHSGHAGTPGRLHAFGTTDVITNLALVMKVKVSGCGKIN